MHCISESIQTSMTIYWAIIIKSPHPQKKENKEEKKRNLHMKIINETIKKTNSSGLINNYPVSFSESETIWPKQGAQGNGNSGTHITRVFRATSSVTKK